MAVRHVSCGEFITEGERKAFERLKNALDRLSPRGAAVGVRGAGTSIARPLPSNGEDDWLIFTNLNHVYDPRRRPDEIDMVVIGPPGAFVIEVKPWEHLYLDRNPDTVNRFAILTNDKAKRVKGTLESVGVNAFVTARILLTAEPLRLPAGGAPFSGVQACGLADWRTLLNVDGASVLGPDQLDLAERALAPASHRRRTGSFSSVGEIDFETDADKRVIDDSEAPFHRVWRGSHRRRQDSLVVHLYDLSVRPPGFQRAGTDTASLARRDFEAMQRVQHLDFVPRIYDSFTDHPEYPGEIAYFTLIDTLARPVLQRQDDPDWNVADRIAFAIAAMKAVGELHNPTRAGVMPIIHRRINPETLRVLSTNEPMLTGFGVSRIDIGQTISAGTGDLPNWGSNRPFVAPEIQRAGLGLASPESDTYSICATLAPVLDPDLLEETMPGITVDGLIQAGAAFEVLQQGIAQSAAEREPLSELVASLEAIARQEAAAGTVEPLMPELWDEAHIVTLGDSNYRVIERLGGGGIGMTFKVVEVDPSHGDHFGTYVAKTINEEAISEVTTRAYRLAKQHTAASQHIATIHEVAGTWSRSAVMCLIEWIDGISLDNYIGVMEIALEDRASDVTDGTVATILLDWMRQVCLGLQTLHRVNLVHGDVSPQNIMARGDGLLDVQLTDFDTVIEAGAHPRLWNPAYASPEVKSGGPISFSDDLFALGAAIYNILTDRAPFEHGGTIDFQRGLGWQPSDPWDSMRGFSELKKILDRATATEPSHRFLDAFVAADAIADALVPSDTGVGGGDESLGTEVVMPTEVLTPKVNPRLLKLLSTYPGSRHGNDEARGLDSEFALGTYVRTTLDDTVLRLVQANEVSLVLLFGNAGDGKTAFLQQLAVGLGADRPPPASDRVWQGLATSGVPVLINFDGSAALGDHSADDMLDEIFAPFHEEGYSHERIHLVAVNSGKLLEWVERVEDSDLGETWLTRQLRQAMGSWAVNDEDRTEPDPRIRLIDLNTRSLVGGINAYTGETSMAFLDDLIDRFAGVGDPDAWNVCRTCSAQDRCTARISAHELTEGGKRSLIRERLGIALQTCHQRGTVHITSRELRGTLSYIFFGMKSCEEVHADERASPEPFWHRAFDATSDGRQASLPLLAELAMLDPANGTEPETDRGLVERILLADAMSGVVDPPVLREERRRAWFYDADADGSPTVMLVGGRNQARFRQVVAMDDADRAILVAELCGGIARLEDLPTRAFAFADDRGEVPIRISPRTPTETILWTTKPLDRFRIKVQATDPAESLFDQLHTCIALVYQSDGETAVTELLIDLALFDVLLQAREGKQLTGTLQAGVFANLGVFSERLAQEGSREVLGWHPSAPDDVFLLRIEDIGGRQVIVRSIASKGPSDAN